MDPQINKHLLTIDPYKPGRPIEDVKKEFGLDRVIKLASNENPIGPSPKAIEAVAKAASHMNLYPDGASIQLRDAIASHYHIPPSQVLLGNGSDELIHLLGLMYLHGPEDEVMVGDPGFSRYDTSAFINRSKLVRVPLNSNLEHDLEAMAKAANQNTKLIYIANPHNPTGSIVREPAFRTFLNALPPTAKVVLDEAYVEYGEGVDELPSALEFVKEGRQVIGLRTFSKAYGLAGIRIGYGFAAPEIVDVYHRVREPFNVNSLAQAAATAALQDREYLKKSVEHNRKARNRLNAIFASLGAKPYESYANFALADFGRPTDGLYMELMKKGIITRAGSWFGLPNCLRVTVGTDEELNFFEEVITSILSPAVAQ